MEWFLLLVTVLTVASGSNLAHKQQVINKLFYRITDPTQAIHISETFKPTGSGDVLRQKYEASQLLKKTDWFSVSDSQHRKEALLLFNALLETTDFDHFMNTAVFFRKHLNEGVFVYALYAAVTHSDVCKGVILPPLYEVMPHLFTKTEAIWKIFANQISGNTSITHNEFPASSKNPEDRMAYYRDDIGMNSNHFYWHINFPFWWNVSEIDRKGEHFFWIYHQMSARFVAERLSNHLDQLREFRLDRPTKEGFTPHTTYRYGGEFPSRPDDIMFQDVDGVAKVREMLDLERRIKDAISLGYIISKNGTHINLDINILGDIIESSTSSPNVQYYGDFYNTVRIMLGRQADPKGKFNMPPGVIEHFETAFRDPSFFSLQKHIDNIFKLHKDTLNPYTSEDIKYENVNVKSVEIDGLITFFEDFYFEFSNYFGFSKDLKDAKVLDSRLNHLPFSYKINVDADHEDTATVRIYLCPKHDYNGIELHLGQYHWKCLEMDIFSTHLNPGNQVIIRTSSDSSVTTPDPVSFRTLIRAADEAAASGADMVLSNARGCGLPNRLLLPKGKTEGMEFILFVALTSDDAVKHLDPVSSGHVSLHCRHHGQLYPYMKSMGYPLDRKIIDENLFNVSNIHTQTVRVYHRGSW